MITLVAREDTLEKALPCPQCKRLVDPATDKTAWLFLYDGKPQGWICKTCAPKPSNLQEMLREAAFLENLEAELVVQVLH